MNSGSEFTAADASRIEGYAKILDCIHCGLCLHTCPTYQLTGAESSSPRGRIHLMRAAAEGRIETDEPFAEEMDFCLVCRHCESVCPAGVQFGTMMEITRAALAERPRGPLVRFSRWLGFRVVLPSRGWLRLSTTLLGVAQKLKIISLLAPLFGERGRALRSFPRVPKGADRRLLPAKTAASGLREGAVAMLEGCVMPEMLGRVNRATAECLAACGLDVHAASASQRHVCCGALHAHNGDLEEARALARSTIEAFDALIGEDGNPLPVVVNSAGCGAHMKAFGELFESDVAWAERAERFAARVVDFSECLNEPEHRARLERALAPSSGPDEESGDRADERLTYDDPCHLCHGQSVRSEPRALLDLLPKARVVELEDSESCCGSAGVYSLLRPKDANAVLAPKLVALRESGANVLVTANPGCQIQWSSGVQRENMDVEVLHLAEAIARRLR